MSVLVLSDADVRELLDMESCVAAMEDALAALARDELSMPLRSVFRPPTDQLMGLMPAHRGGGAPVFSLKEIVVAPANAARGLDPHQGAVLLHDGETGVLRAILNASAITEIRTAAVSAVATKLLARPGARQVAILGSGVQAGSHARRDAGGARRPRAEGLEPHAGARRGTCARVPRERRARRSRRPSTAPTSCAPAPRRREPIVRRAWLAPGAHVNAVGSSVPSSRELDADLVASASLFVDRRESTLNESGDYLRAVEEEGIGPDHILAELGELLVGAHPGRRGDDEVTLFKSLGLAVEDLAAAALCVDRARERGRRRRGAVLIQLEAIERRASDHGRHRRRDARSCGSTSTRPARSG